MKTLVVPDLHGKSIWKLMVHMEEPDKVIFLGDYYDCFEQISTAEQIFNYKEIVKLKTDGTTKLGDINVAKINQKGDEFEIISKKGIPKTIDKEVVNQIFSFVDTGSPNIIKGGVFEPNLILKFV